MNYKHIRSRYFILVRLFIALAILGLIALVITNIGEDPSYLTFSFIAFLISVAALLLTTLQSMTISRQMQITERASHDIRETGEYLQRLIRSDQRLAHDIREDIELDREIISALEEHGVGDSAKERREVARHIAHKLQNKS